MPTGAGAAKTPPPLATGAVSDMAALGPEGQDAELAALKALGGGWVRITWDWSRYEAAGPGSYDAAQQARLDRAVRICREAGIKVLGDLLATPAWARTGDSRFARPTRLTDFTRFARYVARRHAGSVAAWEVWNEEDSAAFWPPAPDPVEYTKMLTATAAAIRDGDSRARVVFGGLAMGPGSARFVSDAYAAGARRSFDVMAAHPYGYGRDPQHVEFDLQGRVSYDWFTGYRTLRADMLARGDDKPIWLTEFGWSTSATASSWGATPVTEEQQAANYTEALKILDRDRATVPVAIAYQLRDAWWDPADTFDGRFGLVRADWSRKPAFAAIAARTRATAAATTQTASVATTQTASAATARAAGTAAAPATAAQRRVSRARPARARAARRRAARLRAARTRAALRHRTR